MDDLVFTSNNFKLISKFRETMISQFEMIDLKLISYFLNIFYLETNDSSLIGLTEIVI